MRVMEEVVNISTLTNQLSTSQPVLNVTSYTSNIIVTVLIALFYLSGSFGSIFTILVIYHDKTLHTSSNFFIFSLCISDLISALVCSPLWLYRRTWGFSSWKLGSFLCKFYWYSDFTTNYVTSLHIVSFAALRFYAVKRPFEMWKVTRMKVLICICFLWIVALGTAIPTINFMNVEDERGPAEPFQHWLEANKEFGRSWPSCSIIENKTLGCCTDQYNLYMKITSPLMFYIPEICVIMLSAIIASTLFKRRRWIYKMTSVYSVSNQINQKDSRVPYVVQAAHVTTLGNSKERNAGTPHPSPMLTDKELKILRNISDSPRERKKTNRFEITSSIESERFHNIIAKYSPFSHRKHKTSERQKMELRYQSERRTFTQLSLIIVAFIIGYIPFTAYLLWTTVNTKTADDIYVDYWFGVVSYLCLRLSECMNPVVYNLGSSNIRATSKKFLKRLFRVK